MNGDPAPDDAGLKKPEQAFPLELVANLAVRVLLAHKDCERQSSYEEAAEVAVCLLQVCRSRLQKDASIQAENQAAEDGREYLRRSQEEWLRLKQKYGDPVPFLNGLLYITQKRSEKEAMPFYTRWRLYDIGTIYAEAESRQFYGQSQPPPQPTQKNLELDLERRRREGFDPVTAAHYREMYAKWHVEVDLPARKRRPGRNRVDTLLVETRSVCATHRSVCTGRDEQISEPARSALALQLPVLCVRR